MCVLAVILCLEVAYDSTRLFYWHLHYINDLILYLCSCIILFFSSFSGIFYAVVRRISMLFTDNKISVFCVWGIRACVRACVHVCVRVDRIRIAALGNEQKTDDRKVRFVSTVNTCGMVVLPIQR